jgi:histidine triad (HIT) family protein
MNECLFCKIIKGEIESTKVYENDKVIAFMDLFPVNKGHTLIIHKKHSDTIFETTPEMIKDIAEVIPKIAVSVKEATKCDGISISQNNEKAAGQVIFHVHFHIIPRFENDGFQTWQSGKYEEGEKELFGTKIRNALEVLELSK